MTPFGRTSLGVLGLLVLVVTVVGCGAKSRKLPVFPARGQVLVGDKPATGAFVYLWPEGGVASGLDAYCPSGQADAEGRFTLSTYANGDGAPAGNYVVTVEWPLRFNAISNQWEGDKLKGRFKDQAASRLRATVEKQPNDLAPIQLSAEVR